MPASIVWFRNDLRLADNPALIAGLGSGRPVVPVYVLDEETEGVRPPGAASRWWLHHSLQALDASLRALGSRLILRRGPAEQVIGELAAECDASAVYWNRAYDQGSRERDARLKQAFDGRGVAARKPEGQPAVRAVGGEDAGRRALQGLHAVLARLPQPAVARSAAAGAQHLPAPAHWPASDQLAAWRLLPGAPDWAGGLGAAWTPGEAGASRASRHSSTTRWRATARRATCRRSTAPRGCRRIWPSARSRRARSGGPRATRGLSAATEKFLTELGWREFAYHLLFHFGDLAQRNFRPEFDAFPWADDDDALEAWQRGRTGYPIVDAGMRELWATGWMHNRVRMIVASFLIKDLLIDWRDGERWFWDTLVDADLANNAAGWQWVAGSGADAAPYFRIFNPVLQGEKFDPGGDYVRRWVPELASLPAETIHRPWTAARKLPPEIYPARIVDHAAARERALRAFRTLKRSA